MSVCSLACMLHCQAFSLTTRLHVCVCVCLGGGGGGGVIHVALTSVHTS